MATVNLILNQRTLLGSQNAKGSWVKKYDEQTSGWVSSSSAYTFYLYATLTSQNITANTSTIKFEHVLTSNGDSYSEFSNARSIVKINSADETAQYCTALGQNATKTFTYTKTFTHNSNGSFGGATISARWRSRATDSDTDYTGTSYAPANNTLGSYTVDVPDFSRSCTLTASKTNIGPSATDATTIATSNPSGLYVICKYKYGSNAAQTLFSGTATSYSQSVSKNSMSAGGVTADSTGSVKFTLTTKTSSSGDTLGTSSVIVYLQGPGQPLSLYDNGSGSVGVSIGQEATGAGFYVNGMGPFTLKTVTINGTSYQILAL